MIGSALLVLVTMVGTLPTADLVDDFGEAGASEFSGRQLVVCWSPDGVVAHITEVGQSAGMTALTSDDGVDFLIGKGKMIEFGSGGVQYLEMGATTAWRLWEGYEVQDRGTDAANRRTVEVSDQQGIRARYVLDAPTGIPISSEVFGPAGDLFRYAALIEVRPTAPDYMDDMMDSPDMPEPDVRPIAEPETLPATAGHYWEADTYEAPGGLQTFYTDGLFRFSVFELSRKTDGGRLADEQSVELAGRRGYHRSYSPGTVAVFWKAPDHSYLLIGDLPPDHLEEVVAELPKPGNANPFKRAWRWVFG